MSSKLKSPTIPAMHILILLLISSSPIHADSPQSLVKVDEFGNQRPCAQGCFQDYSNCRDAFAEDRIGLALGCVAGGCVSAQESCYCRADLQSVAFSFISNCVTSACKPAGAITLDLNAASNIYADYCTAAGYTRMTPEPQSQTLTTTTSSKIAAAPSSTAEIASPTHAITSGSPAATSYIFSTVPPATTTQVLTQVPVTVTKVLVSPSSASFGFNLHMSVVLFVAFICGVWIS